MSQNNCQKEVVLLSSHMVNDFVLRKYRRILADLDKSKYNVILLLNTEEEDHWDVPDDVTCFTTNSETLNALCYNPIEETLLPGSCHFPILRFFLDNPTYSFYWFIEYDVEFTGNWSILLDDCGKNLSTYDFLSCHVERFNEATNKFWPWWYEGNHVGIPLEDCIKGFNPICRYSHQALEHIDKYQKKGYSAHSEVMITTCLYHGGLKIGDFGGMGEFVPDGYEEKFYITSQGNADGGTMRYRPVYSSEEIEECYLPNKLFHPQKQ